MKKNLMITGAGPNGFIGKNLKEAFQYKYNIFAPTRLELNLLDYRKLEDYVMNNKIDVIIHGAIHVPLLHGTENEMEYDMRMFLHIEKLSTLVEKIVYFGSGAEYDKTYDIIQVQEKDIGKSIPQTSYGLAKYTMNKLAMHSKNIYNLRLFGVFGKYELYAIKFISNLCCKAMFDLPLTIRKNCDFNYIYIEDLTRIVEWFIENVPHYHDYNICHTQSYSLLELAHIVREVSQKDLPIQLLNEQRNLDYTGDNTRLMQEMPNFGFTDMKVAIKELYDYYCLNKHLIDFQLIKNSR